MKRVKSAGLLLVIILLFILWGTVYVSLSAETFDSHLENGIIACELRDYPRALEEIALLDESYESKNMLLRLLVHRELLESIRQNIKGLPAFIEADSPEDFIHASRLMQAQLETMERLFFAAF